MTNSRTWILLAALLTGFCRIVAEPPERTLEPGLRRPWMPAEERRVLDWMSGLQKARGPIQGSWWLKDSRGRSFSLSAYFLDFFPFESFGVEIPVDADAPLHMAEARALYEEGGSREALLIWKAFSALPSMGELPAYQRKAAEESSQTLSSLGIPLQGPVALYLSERDETLVSNPGHGYRFLIPGRMRAAHFFHGKETERPHSPERNTIALRQRTELEDNRYRELTIIASSEYRTPPPDMGYCTVVWQERVGITAGVQKKQRIRHNKFELERKEGPGDPGGAGESGDEALYTVKEEGQDGFYLEYYRIEDGLCFHLRLFNAIYRRSPENLEAALAGRGKKIQDQLESYDGDRSLDIFREIHRSLVVP